MNKLDVKSPEESAEQQSSLQEAMILADLQERLMTVDMETITPAEIQELFAEYEGNETAQKLKSMMYSVLRMREEFDDPELFEKLFDKKPLGTYKIEMTPVSFSVGLYPVDWVRMKEDGNILSYCISTAGQSGNRDVEIDGIKLNVGLDTYKAWLPSRKPIKLHEARHSINRILERKSYEEFDLDPDSDAEVKIAQTINFVSRSSLKALKNELSAYILDGTSMHRLNLWTFRSRYTLGLYNFHGMPGDFWDYCASKGLTKEEISQIKQTVAQLDIKTIVARSYKAVQILEQKGYNRFWAVSFLCSGGNFLKDWLTVAEACPDKTNQAQ